MTDAERQRLAAILGMLGSNSAGERDAAALAAEEFRKQRGMTWEQLVSGQTIYINREIEVPVDRPVFVPMPFVKSVITSLVDNMVDVRTFPGFFFWAITSVAVIDVLYRLSSG